MESPDSELRMVLVKITDLLTGNDLRKLKFIFSDEIRREGVDDTTINGAIDFFQQLLDRRIIDSRNLSKLINTLDDIGCFPAAQLLKNYQYRTSEMISSKSTVAKTSSILEELWNDNELEKPSIHDMPPLKIDEQPSIPQGYFLLNNNKNATSRLTIYDQTNMKTIRKNYFICFLIIFLIYTMILILLTYYLISKFPQQTKALPIGEKRIFNQAQTCQPSPYERYFIKSLYNEKLIGVVNNISDQGEKLSQWNDRKTQLCHHQWYFIPLSNEGKEKIYMIQSVYNRKVFDVPGGNPSNENSIQQWDMAMNNVHQQFRLIHIPKENSCQIQSLVTNKVLNAITNELITQADFQINEKESIVEKKKTLWQLIPFDIDRFGEKLTDCPYVSSINDLTVIKFGQVFGDNGGYSTDDSKKFRLTMSHYISSISIISSDWLNSMECIYSSSNPLQKESPKSGFIRGDVRIYNQNYHNQTFNVTERNPNERIDRVYMFISFGKDYPKVSTRYIVGIQFHTTYNRTSPLYGNREGQLFIEEYQGFVLGYVRGGAAMYIERLQFIWYKTTQAGMADTPVYFYRRNEPFGEFSNFYSAPFELDGYTWPTTEHYFQAQKYVSDQMHFHHVLQLATPRAAFNYVRTYKSAVRSDWANVKDDIMFKACMAKFQQHPKLKELLLSTGDRTLVEHTSNDSYWGDGGDGTGRNQLGITLMKVRDYLKNN